MSPSEVFSLVGMMAMPMWLLMILLPKWKITRLLIDYKIIPIALSIIYAMYIAISLSKGGGMDFGSLEDLGIHQLLMAPCLAGTFMLGPVGFLLFMALRAFKLSKS